jgi:hypothetical protein
MDEPILRPARPRRYKLCRPAPSREVVRPVSTTTNRSTAAAGCMTAAAITHAAGDERLSSVA